MEEAPMGTGISPKRVSSSSCWDYYNDQACMMCLCEMQ